SALLSFPTRRSSDLSLTRRRGRATLWLRFGHLERQLPIDCHNFDFVTCFDAAAKQFFRERVFEETLHCTAHWPRSVLRLVSFLRSEEHTSELQSRVE